MQERVIDLNGDLGEGVEVAGQSLDALMMPHVSSANIACGGHAGDAASMEAALRLARQHGVAVGAHPSYSDRTHFGRRAQAVSGEALMALVGEQIDPLRRLAARVGVPLQHVKLHGALYHAAAQQDRVAAAVVRAVKVLDAELVVYGLPESALARQAEAWGVAFAAEGFPDRAYHADGSLFRQPNGAS